MRKKLFFSVLASIALTFSFLSCSNDESTQSSQDQQNQTSAFSVGNETGDLLIGKVINGTDAEFTIDVREFETEFLKHGIFAEIESVEIGDEYLTIIGKDINDYSLLAFQAELIRDASDNLYYPDVESASNTTFATHKCDGVNCTGCEYKRKDDKKRGKIIGCNCSGGAGSSGSDSYCNHSTSKGDTVDDAKKIADLVATVIKVITAFL